MIGDYLLQRLGVPTEYFEVMADARELNGWRDREDICLVVFEQPQKAQQLLEVYQKKYRKKTPFEEQFLKKMQTILLMQAYKKSFESKSVDVEREKSEGENLVESARQTVLCTLPDGWEKKTPNASPFVVLMPMALPKIGNRIAASTLKKNMTEIACATSSSSASMTGAVAATAEPPQMEDPTPINVEILDSMCITLCKIHATTSDVLIVQMIIGNDCFPVCKITPRFMPNPRSTTAVCKIVFDVHLMPASALPFSFQNKVRIIPRRMAKMAPPTIGNIFPRSQEGTAIARQTKIPAPFCFIKFMVLPLFSF